MSKAKKCNHLLYYLLDEFLNDPSYFPGLDLEYETDIPVTAPEPALYETAYVTSHKNFCRAGAFSADGKADIFLVIPYHIWKETD